MSKLLQIEEPKTTAIQHQASLQDFLELGFRPLYLVGTFWAIVAVLAWVFVPTWLQGRLTGVYWHAHEMLWGFIGAITVGFLLTATKNWTGHNPLQGKKLGALVSIWLIARVALLIPGDWGFAIGSLASLGFYAWATAAVARCLLITRNKHNYILPVLLAALVFSEAAFLYTYWRASEYTQLMHYLFTGMLCMLTVALLIARRIIPFFASRALQGLALPRHERSGKVQTGLAALAILSWLLAMDRLSALLFLAAALITLWHLLTWKPQKVLKTPLLWILYVGYLGLGLGLCTAALYAAGLTTRLSWPVHVIAVAGFSTLILGMVTRTALGHTGRLLQISPILDAAFALLLIAVIFRMLALGANTSNIFWLYASAGCWALAFGIYLVKFFPILTQPRLDKRSGKPINLSRSS